MSLSFFEDENDIVFLTVSKKNALEIVRNYYQKYENFKGIIRFKVTDKTEYDEDFGFYEVIGGKMSLIFTEEVEILNKKVKRSVELPEEDIDLEKIFSTVFEEEDYEVCYAYFKKEVPYGKDHCTCRGVKLKLKRKSKEKVLQK